MPLGFGSLSLQRGTIHTSFWPHPYIVERCGNSVAETGSLDKGSEEFVPHICDIKSTYIRCFGREREPGSP